jgi:hypothetical protein
MSELEKRATTKSPTSGSGKVGGVDISAGNAGVRPAGSRAAPPALLRGGITPLPPRGKVNSKRNWNRMLRSDVNLHKLGQLYRATVPKGKRTYKAWLRFLRKHAPLYVGKAR